MKHELLREQLKKMKGVPVYQCPHCQTVWLIVGGEVLTSYTCNNCDRPFDPALARYDKTKPKQATDRDQLPQAA